MLYVFKVLLRLFSDNRKEQGGYEREEESEVKGGEDRERMGEVED